METASTPLTDSQLSAVLHARGQRVTPQRLVINRALHELNRHVTAEEVLASVTDRLPNVSAPTRAARQGKTTGRRGRVRRYHPQSSLLHLDRRGADPGAAAGGPLLLARPRRAHGRASAAVGGPVWLPPACA